MNGQPAPRRAPFFGAKAARDLDQPQGGNPLEAARRVDAAAAVEDAIADTVRIEADRRLEEDHHPEKVDRSHMSGDEGEDDPALLPAHVAAKRTGQLVDNVTDAAMLELKKLRDRIDDLLRDMQSRRDAIKESIMGQAEFAESSIRAAGIIGEHVDRIRQDFEAKSTPLPGIRRAN